MTTVGEDRTSSKVLVEQASPPATPAAGTQKLFIDSADGNLYLIDEADVVTPVGSSTAFHSDVDGEIDALAEKATPVAGDFVLIEDSEDSFAKKKVDVDSLAGSGGGLVLLEQHAASNSALLAFVSGITGTYDKYLLEITDFIVQTNNVSLLMQYSTDAGSSYDTSNNYYSAGFLIRNGGGTEVIGANPSTAFIIASGVVNTVSRPIEASIKMSAFPSTALSKPLNANISYTNQTHVVGGFLQGLLLVPGTAYNSFKLYCSSGNIVSGVARLYGLEN